MKRGSLLILIIMSIFLCSCMNTNRNQNEKRSEEKPDSLKVYLGGEPMGGENVQYYFNACAIGPIWPLFVEPGYDGHMLYKTLKQYEAETGIKLELQFFHLKKDMEKQLIQDQQAGTMPDLILLDNYTYGGGDTEDNFYRLLASDWFYDLTAFTEEEELYGSGDYYNEVLQAGKWKNQQLVLPIQFNLSAVYVSKEDMADLGIYLEQGMPLEDVLNRLGAACAEAEGRKEAVDFLGSNHDISLLIEALWEASGMSAADYENQQVTMDREVFEEIAEFYKQYLMMEYRDQWEDRKKTAKAELENESWLWGGRAEGLTALAGERDANLTERDAIDEWLNKGIFYMEGGNGLQTLVHSFIGQAAFLDTLYTDMQKEMCMVGLPCANDSEGYAALVRLCGGVMKESEHPYYSYQLIRYLMDHSEFPYHTISVNRNVTNEMLDTLSETEYELDPMYGVFEGAQKDSERSILIKPLKEETRDEIEYMLDHIETGSLPNFSTYLPIMKHIEGYALEAEDMDTAYENACSELEESMNSTVGEVTTIRWAITEERSLGRGNSEDSSIPFYSMDAERIEKLNALLKEKGYGIQLEMEYLLYPGEQSELAFVDSQEKSFDIVTFHMAGIGGEEMEQYLAPLEGYMAEGGALHEVYEQFSQQLWESDQINGHNYNVGRLTEIIYPRYSVWFIGEEDPGYPIEALQSGSEEAIYQMVEELGVGLKMAEPFVTGYGDELGVQYYFHMIAPGVGFNIEDGTAFENVWESELIEELTDRELRWLLDGTAVHIFDSDRWDNEKLFRRYISGNYEMAQWSVERSEGRRSYYNTIPVTSEGRWVPWEKRYYTSIFKKTAHVEKCVELLAALNTDPELFQAIYSPVSRDSTKGNLTSFYELCNYEAMLGNKSTLSERVAALPKEQISPILGFVFDERPVQQEVDALKKLVNEEFYNGVFMTREELEEKAEAENQDIRQVIAAAWREEFARFQARMREAGIERVIEEANRQLEAWQAER